MHDDWKEGYKPFGTYGKGDEEKKRHTNATDFKIMRCWKSIDVIANSEKCSQEQLTVAVLNHKGA